ncbi:hypothetical protein FISHEDRAFT_65624 [Fistulina hepatica ATCC 64428]|uniref:non-specific serine/threonine protein kinase n=1 Tax=Fistulina hepatica ATCC 64428 TaxID=1128425 RepID=A0A0D7AEA7_9AGAR|nr:hypothetical protein FISHEDRAFT_65624 [Fistulina hepatica ATCC 64428]
MLIKYRFNKQYRHPILDSTLTKSRIGGEARALVKCLRAGVSVPGVRMVNAPHGLLGVEWIDGQSVRRILGDDDAEDVVRRKHGLSSTAEALMAMIGTEIARMHAADIIHGDLTTSNMMLRHVGSAGSPLVLIDFGLAYTSSLVEDKAVDLYVLERAFASTHPDSEPLFASVLTAYAKEAGKQWNAISKRLDDVRLRGRKRSMVG